VPLGEVLDRQVALLREAHRAGDPVAAQLLRGTARGAASYAGHTEIVALIDEWLASS
jgi:hypothetical protein